MMDGKLIQIGNLFYIESAQPMSSEPTLIVTRWRVTAIDGDYEIGETLSFQGIWHGRRARIGTEANADDITSELRPIPCPETKLKTRWSERGYWQKYTAAKGWVMA